LLIAAAVVLVLALRSQIKERGGTLGERGGTLGRTVLAAGDALTTARFLGALLVLIAVWILLVKISKRQQPSRKR